MRARIILYTFFILWTGLISYGQTGLTLDDCQQKARDHYPQIKQYGLLELSRQYDISNLGKNYLPQVSLNAQATYQSDVVTLPVNVPGIPTVDKDQYKATIDISQTIWDGGVVHSRKSVTRASNEVDKQQVEVDLYAIRERVNQLFFGILTANEQLKQLDILTEDLQTSHRLVNAFLQNGTGTQSDVDAIQVEILNTEQKRTEITSYKESCIKMLSWMINETIPDDMPLIKPSEADVPVQPEITRPEMLLFTRQGELLKAREDLITSGNRPHFSLFLQGGYGKPGLNMLSDDFKFFYIGGVRMNWNFGSLYTTKNDRNKIVNQINRIQVQQETFVFHTHLKLVQAYDEIRKSKDLMGKDDEIIFLRNRVKKAAESKYSNGVYTVNDLVKDINAESQSRQARILHEIEYLMNIYHYKEIAGF